MLDYKVRFEVFEGPLDLLLYLVKRQEVDIYRVNLTRLATEFVEWVELMRELDLDIAGEFLVMAATLMYLKSRELLPVEERVGEEEEEEEDPRWELIRKLVEYKKYKDAAEELAVRESRQSMTYSRAARPPAPAPTDRPVEASIFDLVHALNRVLKRLRDRAPAEVIEDDPWTVATALERLRALLMERDRIRFEELFAEARSRVEAGTFFLALLELIRLGAAVAIQREPFGEIEVVARRTEAGAGAGSSGKGSESEG